eukprot:CAMPEP_0194506554 /NCGR_PEP_ID=MMETSP0253-20130528/35049_1 /TAXON_ID=2966 /ORGANISM="Noctiluca scintillans" /LENGTH=502 /DNA_ID=CAMNT_0039349311 /DNA_START=1 /DNA_END=1506 /DNA_ORIENTATION=-
MINVKLSGASARAKAFGKLGSPANALRVLRTQAPKHGVAALARNVPKARAAAMLARHLPRAPKATMLRSVPGAKATLARSVPKGRGTLGRSVPKHPLRATFIRRSVPKPSVARLPAKTFARRSSGPSFPKTVPEKAVPLAGSQAKALPKPPGMADPSAKAPPDFPKAEVPRAPPVKHSDDTVEEVRGDAVGSEEDFPQPGMTPKAPPLPGVTPKGLVAKRALERASKVVPVGTAKAELWVQSESEAPVARRRFAPAKGSVVRADPRHLHVPIADVTEDDKSMDLSELETRLLLGQLADKKRRLLEQQQLQEQKERLEQQKEQERLMRLQFEEMQKLQREREQDDTSQAESRESKDEVESVPDLAQRRKDEWLRKSDWRRRSVESQTQATAQQQQQQTEPKHSSPHAQLPQRSHVPSPQSFSGPQWQLPEQQVLQQRMSHVSRQAQTQLHQRPLHQPDEQQHAAPCHQFGPRRGSASAGSLRGSDQQQHIMRVLQTLETMQHQ